MDACTQGQLPWMVTIPGSPMSGASPDAACTNWASLQGKEVTTLPSTDGECVVVTPGGEDWEVLPISQVCTAENEETMSLSAACPASAPCTWTLQMPPQALSLTAPEVAYAVSFGVGAVLSLWVIGYAVGAAVRLIRSL